MTNLGLRIGWSDANRGEHSQQVVANSRVLIFTRAQTLWPMALRLGGGHGARCCT